MSVNARALLVKTKTSGVDPLVDQILVEGSPENTLYKQALGINQSDLKRSYVEACLLASQDYAQISSILEVPEDLVKFYAEVFYDVGTLDKLSKMELLADAANEQESLLKMWGLSQGLNFIAWRLSKPTAIGPVEGLQDLYTLSVYKSKEALFSGNSSESSKEATKWTKLSLDLARMLKAWVLDSDSAKKDIELALQEVVPDFEGFEGLDND